MKLATEFDENAFSEFEYEPLKKLTAGDLIEELKKYDPNTPLAFANLHHNQLCFDFITNIAQRQVITLTGGEDYILTRDDESDYPESRSIIFLNY
jgi:hypothetical protein